MRIFFIGSVRFSEKTLEKVLSLGGKVVGVATKSQSSFNSDHVDLSSICERESIPFKYVRDINAPHIISWIKDFEPEVIFCFGWSSLIKKNLLDIPQMGIIGFHASALPYNKGRHPSIWAVVLGLKESATSFFFMKEGADDGAILSQKPFLISYDDDASSVYKKIEENALEQIQQFLPALESGNYKTTKQDPQNGNTWRKRGREDGRVDFRMNSFAIYNLVRGLTKPFIGAHLDYKGEEVKIWKAKEEKCELNNLEPGKVLEIKGDKILVKTYDNAIWLLEHTFSTLPQKNEYL